MGEPTTPTTKVKEVTEVGQTLTLPPGGELDDLISRYIDTMVTGLTKDWCACPWLIHPEDLLLPWEQQRKRREDTHPLCPTHTREGLIKGFILWAVKNGH